VKKPNVVEVVEEWLVHELEGAMVDSAYSSFKDAKGRIAVTNLIPGRPGYVNARAFRLAAHRACDAILDKWTD